MLHVKAVNHPMFRYDFFQQHPKLRNVPLSISQCVKLLALSLFGTNIESGIEGTASSDNTQCLVQHEYRLVDCVDDALGERASITNVGKLLPEVGCQNWKYSRTKIWALQTLFNWRRPNQTERLRRVAWSTLRRRVCIKQDSAHRRSEAISRSSCQQAPACLFR